VAAGYVIGSIVGGDLTQATFATPTGGITCDAALGWTETSAGNPPVATDCGIGGTAFGLTGCTAKAQADPDDEADVGKAVVGDPSDEGDEESDDQAADAAADTFAAKKSETEEKKANETETKEESDDQAADAAADTSAAKKSETEGKTEQAEGKKKKKTKTESIIFLVALAGVIGFVAYLCKPEEKKKPKTEPVVEPEPVDTAKLREEMLARASLMNQRGMMDNVQEEEAQGEEAQGEEAQVEEAQGEEEHEEEGHEEAIT